MVLLLVAAASWLIWTGFVTWWADVWGYDGFGFGVLALIASPPLAGGVLLVLGRRTKTAKLAPDIHKDPYE